MSGIGTQDMKSTRINESLKNYEELKKGKRKEKKLSGQHIASRWQQAILGKKGLQEPGGVERPGPGSFCCWLSVNDRLRPGKGISCQLSPLSGNIGGRSRAYRKVDVVFLKKDAFVSSDNVEQKKRSHFCHRT